MGRRFAGHQGWEHRLGSVAAVCLLLAAAIWRGPVPTWWDQLPHASGDTVVRRPLLSPGMLQQGACSLQRAGGYLVLSCLYLRAISAKQLASGTLLLCEEWVSRSHWTGFGVPGGL